MAPTSMIAIASGVGPSNLELRRFTGDERLLVAVSRCAEIGLETFTET